MSGRRERWSAGPAFVFRGGSAFLFRWGTRLVRHNWRQQLGLLALIAATVAVAVGGIVAAFNLSEPPGSRFGRGAVGATLAGYGEETIESLEAQGHPFGVIRSATIRTTGTTGRIDVRSMDPTNPVTEPLLALTSGRWPVTASEVAVTDRAVLDRAGAFAAAGDTVEIAGSRTVVGVVENPTNLHDEFVLAPSVEPYGVDGRLVVTELLVDAAPSDVTFPAGTWGITIEDGGPIAVRTFVAIAVTVVSTVALLIVALMAGAGFAVLARRRARQYGLLAAAGATPRQIRTAAAATGLSTGLAASAGGAVVGVGAALVVVPRLETVVAHRIDLSVPWWTVVPTVVMAMVAATIAAWWPARALARQPVAALLAAMRPKASSTTRTSRIGVVTAAVGVVALTIGTSRVSAPIVVAGIVSSVSGLLLLAPRLVELTGRYARALPIASRLAGREITRQQGRSTALIAAVAIALAIPVGVAVVTTSLDRHDGELAPNLDDTMAIVWEPTVADEALAVPADIDHERLAAAGARIQEAADDGAAVVPIDVVIDADAPLEPRQLPGQGTVLAVSTNFGLRPADTRCAATCDVNTLGDRDENGAEILVSFHETWVATPAMIDALGVGTRQAEPGVQAISRFDDAMIKSHRQPDGPAAANVAVEASIPANGGIAPTLIWPSTVTANGWETSTIGWLVVGEQPLSSSGLDDLRAAAGDDLVVELPVEPAARSGLRAASVAVGAVVALAVVGAALTMLAAESAGDRRVLQSIGASPSTRRRTSAAAAALLSGAGALLAVPIGYLALLVLLADEFTDYRFVVPWPSLATVLVLVPVMAAALGWVTSRTVATGLGRPTA